MIKTVKGNLLEEDVQALVNTVNCVGVMGRGIALQFKNAFPENYSFYHEACKNKTVSPGKVLVFERQDLLSNPQYIINFPTKLHWREKSKLSYITEGLDDLAHAIEKLKITSIAVPPLGCGLGGLEWDIVKKEIINRLGNLDSQILIFEPASKSEVFETISRKGLKITPAINLVLWLMETYQRGLLDPMISLLELQKMVYFATRLGIEPKFTLEACTSGPYCKDLRFVLNRIEGHYVKRYADAGDSPDKCLTLIKTDDSEEGQELKNSFQGQMSQLKQLIDGFESPKGMEILSTVDLLMNQNKEFSEKQLVARVHNWNVHKAQFTEKQILLARERLTSCFNYQ